MADISWINDNIAISGVITDKDIPLLAAAGIAAIIDLRSEYTDNEEIIKKYQMQFLHIAVDDRYPPAFAQLEKIFDFALPLLDKGRKILIHCQNGCGRAPLAAAAILAKQGRAIADAVNLVQARHPRTGFTDIQNKFIYVELKEYLKPKK